MLQAAGFFLPLSATIYELGQDGLWFPLFTGINFFLDLLNKLRAFFKFNLACSLTVHLYKQ